MDERRNAEGALAEIVALPRGDEAARAARAIVTALVAARSRDVATLAAPILRSSALAPGELTTSHGDPVAVLERGPNDAAERMLASALVARGVALSPPAGVDAEDRAVGELLWAAAHAGLDVFPSLDAALGERALGPWGALCDLVRRIDGGREPSFDRADALMGASALSFATHPDVRAARSRLADEVADPALRAALTLEKEVGEPAFEAGPTLTGEVEPAPRSPLATVLLLLCGYSLVASACRLFARVALARRQPAEIDVTREGVRVRTRLVMLGRTLRESEHVMPAAALMRATREVRFPRVTLYAGLLALALGSFFGVWLFVDGARAASPSMLGQGLLLVAVGIALELALTALVPGAKGRCRLVLVPRRGSAVCVGGLDIDAADRTLARLRR